MIRDPGPGDIRATTPSEDPTDVAPAPPVLHVAPFPVPVDDGSTDRDGTDGGSDDDPGDAAGEPVVDLRSADRPKVSVGRSATLPVTGGRRAIDPPAGDPADVARPDGRPPAPPPVERTAELTATPNRSGLAARAFRSVAVPVVVLLVTISIATALLVGARSSALAAAETERAVRDQLTARIALDELQSAVLATVAAGVGQPVVTPEELPRRSAAARAALESAAASGSAGSDARSSATAYLDAVDDAVERTGADPLELGNELTSLDSRLTEATTDSADAVRQLEQAAEQDADESGRRALLAIVIAVLGVVLAGVSALGARRRLVAQLDRPVGALRTSVREVGKLRPAMSPVVQGADELVALGAEIDAAATTVAERLSTLERRADWGERSRMILEALELADDESEAYDVIGEALGLVGGDHRGELLLSERGTTRLSSVAWSSTAGAPGCPVDATGSCVALRRGLVSVFESSESINACPKLRDRAGGPCSAVCVPVTISARPLGVLHLTAVEGSPPAPEVVEHLVTISSQIGHRLGALRTLESSRQEASTDGLTGLPNRRTLEAEVAELIEAETPFVMVLADLDKFKRLNDNFGHEVGDKALQLFAGVLRDNVRGNDVVARLGGEEFVLVYPNMSVEISIEAIGRVRQALARTVGASRIPPFTCSFGIAHSTVGADGDVILRVADAGLLRAKELGGDQAVVADDELAADVFAEGTTPRHEVVALETGDERTGERPT